MANWPNRMTEWPKYRSLVCRPSGGVPLVCRPRAPTRCSMPWPSNSRRPGPGPDAGRLPLRSTCDPLARSGHPPTGRVPSCVRDQPAVPRASRRNYSCLSRRFSATPVCGALWGTSARGSTPSASPPPPPPPPRHLLPLRLRSLPPATLRRLLRGSRPFSPRSLRSEVVARVCWFQMGHIPLRVN